VKPSIRPSATAALTPAPAGRHIALRRMPL
jgi:hypothetical protein